MPRRGVGPRVRARSNVRQRVLVGVFLRARRVSRSASSYAVARAGACDAKPSDECVRACVSRWGKGGEGNFSGGDRRAARTASRTRCACFASCSAGCDSARGAVSRPLGGVDAEGRRGWARGRTRAILLSRRGIRGILALVSRARGLTEGHHLGARAQFLGPRFVAPRRRDRRARPVPRGCSFGSTAR